LALPPVGSSGTCQKSWPEKKSPGSVTWNWASRLRWTLNWSTGYRKCSASSGGIALLGLTSFPPNALFHAFSTGSLSPNWYRFTVPS
jgi:hypothetical protein